MLNSCLTESHQTTPAQFTNTWIGGNVRVSLLYLVYRWGLAVLFIFSLVQSIIQNTVYFLNVGQRENVYKYFIYLTNNGRLIAAVAFSLEAGLVTARWRQERQERQERLEEERVRLPLSYRVCWVLSNINSSMSVLICLVYWCALYSPHKHQLDFENFSGHLLTSVACVLDVWISDRPWRLSHALHPILFGAVFGVFSLIFHFLRGSNYFFEPYIYHILDWNRPSRTSLVIAGVFLSLVVLHLLFYLMFRIRSGISRGRKKSLSEPGALIDQEV